jgi:branched-chain amino acid transport system ATP-binding protein
VAIRGAMADDIILSTEGLTKEFRGFVAVHDVRLTVRRGTIHALIGANGAGKTTCFNLLTKFLKPTHGSIVYQGQDITSMGPAAIARAGMVRSFQISAVFGHMTAQDNVRVALQRRHENTFAFWRPDRVLRRYDGRARELLDAVGILDYADIPAIELPYGRKRALEIATTLALEPTLMLLDEPTAGVGHEEVGRLAALIREVARDRTVLMVEHNLDVVADLSDVITVLARGEVITEGDYATVSHDQRVIESYLGAGHG